MVINYYEVLGIPRGSGSDEIQSAFKGKSKKWHPDANAGGSEEHLRKCHSKMIELIEARNVLMNADSRRLFDEELREFERHGAGAPEDFGSQGDLTEVRKRVYEAARREAERQADLEFERLFRNVASTTVAAANLGCMGVNALFRVASCLLVAICILLILSQVGINVWLANNR